MDTTNTSFLLNKTQHTAFIAKWKSLHAAKHKFSARDFVLYHLFTSDLSSMSQKITRSFKDISNATKLRNGSYPNQGFRDAMHSALHTIRWNKAYIADLVSPGLLSEEQFKEIEAKTLAIYQGKN